MFGCALMLVVVYKVWTSAINENLNPDSSSSSLIVEKRDDGKPSRKAAYRYERYANRNKVNQGSPGELGAAVSLSAKEQTLADSLFKKEAFNIIASNRLAMNRTLKDLRDGS